MTYESATDRELWQQACHGDREAFGVLFDRHAQAVHTFLFRRTASWTDAEDLTSAVFLLAWRRRADVVLDRESALPWLYGVARHAVLNRGRTLARYQALQERLPRPADVPDHAEDVASRVDDERAMSAVRRSVARLPDDYREVVELCVWAGLDQQAAATALGVTVGTVKSRMHRARARLGVLIADELAAEGGDATVVPFGPRRTRESSAYTQEVS